MNDPGVPLAHYRQHSAGVRFTCRDCQHHADLPLEAVIARLEARKLGGELTGCAAAWKKDPLSGVIGA
jgi:hypothetical protein